jgi:hypothetical protein
MRLSQSAVVALGLLLTPGSVVHPGPVCPEYRVASGVTVDGTAFFAAHHHRASELCVNKGTCVTAGAGASRPAVLFIPVAGPGELRLRVTVTTRAGAALLDALVYVRVRHVVFDAACGITANRGSVRITAAGALVTSLGRGRPRGRRPGRPAVPAGGHREYRGPPLRT